MTENLWTQFQQNRPYLFAVAYRMLGSVADAEDILQDAYLKTRGLKLNKVDKPKAYFSKVITRLCLDRLNKLKRERAFYEGPWLPDPIETKDHEVQHQSLTTAYLLMLENLNPVERAIYLLRSAFDHQYEDIALILNKTPENCRQIFRRAKMKLAKRENRFHQNPEKTRTLLEALLESAERGEYEAMTHLFVHDAMMLADSGGKVKGALKNTLNGIEKVCHFIIGVTKKFKPEDAQIVFRNINNSPTAVVFSGSSIFMVLSIQHNGEKITTVYVTANPNKLKNLSTMDQNPMD